VDDDEPSARRTDLARQPPQGRLVQIGMLPLPAEDAPPDLEDQ
jgi:hypothetical protein